MERASHSSCVGHGESKVPLLKNTFWTVFTMILVLSSLFATGVSQRATDFISIDCGGRSGFIDPDVKIEWLTDVDFLDSGKQLADNLVAIPADVNLDDATVGTYKPVIAEILKTATVFLPGVLSLSKYCYVLPVQSTSNYLVRAIFPNSDLTAKSPYHNTSLKGQSTRFYFTVDSTFVATIELHSVKTRTVELVVPALDEKMYICLVPLEDRSSMPAISSIELRPLPAALYLLGREGAVSKGLEVGNSGLPTSYLMTVSRLNFGAEVSSPAIRYPVDAYDRLWYAAGANDTTDPSQFKSSNSSVSTFVNKNANFDQPGEVMRTAWEGRSMSSNISFTFNVTAAQSLRPISTFYISIHFGDVNPSANVFDARSVEVFLEMDGTKILWGRATTLTAASATSWYNTKQRFTSGEPTFWVIPSATSTLPAMVNAFELFGEFEATTRRTTDADGLTIKSFSDEFENRLDLEKFLDRVGDPCLPVPWSWLVCSIETPPRITTINITSIGAKGRIPTDFGNLDRLSALDLSNNSFSGELPESLAEIKTLRELNLADNNLTGILPSFKENSSLLNLKTLSLRGNKFTGNLLSLFKALGPESPISKIDLSYNNFNGTIPEDTRHLAALEALDLSSNSLSGNVNVIVELIKLKKLETLNLQGNSFAGMVPDEIWSSESKLHTVNLDENKFSMLNLTSWYLSVTGAKSFDASDIPRKVRLLRNEISSIILPRVEIDIPVPQDDVNRRLSLQNPVAFILLGDSPWCESRKKPDRTLIERYLCRTIETEDFWPPPNTDQSVSTETLIAVGVTCGLLVFIMSCIFMFFMRRMHRRTRELQQLQEALAKENVKPPFFKYEDIKAATRNFSSNNILGSGGFGTVYKAEFPDGNILAVKKLLPTEQNVSDFFKEMVNIMGIKHKHLIQLKGCCVGEKLQRMLIYEYAENKNLAEALWGDQKPFTLSWRQRFKLGLGIARGLAYLHEELHPKMIHRDIKPQNILLDKDYNAKIADFGLIRPAHTDETQVTLNIGGTRGYGAPEYMNEGIVSEKLDVYSFGVVLLEIVSGRVCIDYTLPEDQISLRNWALMLNKENKLLNLLDKGLTGEYDHEEVLLILQTGLACCQLDSKKRPTMSQVVNRFMKHEDIGVEIVEQLRLHGTNVEDIFLRKGDEIEDSSSTLVETSKETIVELSSSSSMHPR